MKNTSAAVNETEGRTAYLGRRGWSEPDAHIYTPLKTEAGKSVLAKGDRRTFADTASKKDKPVIPLFFATDDNYLPFLGVTLCSLKENSSKDYLYKVYVLHSGVSENYYEKIMRFSEEGFEISFVDVSQRLQEISSLLDRKSVV